MFFLFFLYILIIHTPCLSVIICGKEFARAEKKRIFVSYYEKLFKFYRKIFLYLRCYFGLFESILASFLSCFLEIARYSLQNAKENLLKIPLK